MSSSNQRVIDRIRKLIELSNSTTFEGERSSSAVEAVRLIFKNKIQIGGDEETAPPPTTLNRSSMRTKTYAPQMTWERINAQTTAKCAFCNKRINRGEEVFARPGTHTYIHGDWPDCP